ncbi:MAG: [Clostridia bacterium]|nr:[FeFe] hydrogenase H-cluster maturation GTPase HydF [Clostridia bacterium]
NEMQYRYKNAISQNIPITNYGIVIAYMNGIIKRSTSVFPELKMEM